MESKASGGSSGNLSVEGQTVPASPLQPDDPDSVDEQWSAVINIHDSNLNQIEVALQANQHQFDPHPSGQPGRYVRRHPVYIVAVNYSQPDEEGNPAPGKPLELDLTSVRDVFATRYPFVSNDGPPEDGSHIRIRDSHFIAERDSTGTPTGRVRLGNLEE